MTDPHKSPAFNENSKKLIDPNTLEPSEPPREPPIDKPLFDRNREAIDKAEKDGKVGK